MCDYCILIERYNVILVWYIYSFEYYLDKLLCRRTLDTSKVDDDIIATQIVMGHGVRLNADEEESLGTKFYGHE